MVFPLRTGLPASPSDVRQQSSSQCSSLPGQQSRISGLWPAASSPRVASTPTSPYNDKDINMCDLPGLSVMSDVSSSWHGVHSTVGHMALVSLQSLSGGFLIWTKPTADPPVIIITMDTNVSFALISFKRNFCCPLKMCPDFEGNWLNFTPTSQLW